MVGKKKKTKCLARSAVNGLSGSEKLSFEGYLFFQCCVGLREVSVESTGEMLAGSPCSGRFLLTIGSISVRLPLNQSPELNQELVASRELDYCRLSLREGFKIHCWL